MSPKLQRKLFDLFNCNYIILIKDNPYVDSPVTEMEEADGEIVYNSETFDQRPLSEVDEDYVMVLKPEMKWQTSYKPIMQEQYNF